MINVLLIEDHTEFRESVSYILNSTKGFNCCGKYSSLESALLSVENPNVILLDVNLPGISGIEGIPELRQAFPKAAILMLTVLDDNESVFRAILAGADGYLLKTTSPARILQAVEDASIGGYPMSPTVARQAMIFFRKHLPAPKESDLTEREKEILQLLIDGYNNDDIAKKLFISIQTVRNHIRHIYEKLHVHSKSQAVVKAIKENLI